MFHQTHVPKLKLQAHHSIDLSSTAQTTSTDMKNKYLP